MAAAASLLDEHEHAPYDLLSGLPSWIPPSNVADITEAQCSATDIRKLIDIRKRVTDKLRADNGRLSPSHELKKAYSDFHWRDIYALCAHHTKIVPTPDPRVRGASAPATSSRVTGAMADYRVHQFLVACSRDVVKASEMLCDFLYWWQMFGMDDLCSQPVCPFADVAVLFNPPRLHGVDQHGRPLLVGTPGSISVERFVALKLPLQWSWIVQAYLRERIDHLLIDASARRGVRISQFTAIADLSGISLDHRHLLPWATGGSYLASRFYPETTGCIAVVNAPRFFPLIWAIIKHLVVEHTRQKVTVLSSDYQPALNKLIGAEQVPGEWRGECAQCGKGQRAD